MARSHATIYASIWDTESSFRHLHLEQQWAYFMLLSQPELTLVGVLKYDWKNWARNAADLGYETLRGVVDGLRDAGFIVCDDDTDELWIRQFMYHDRVFRQPQVAMAAASAFGAVRSTKLRECIRASVPPGVREVWPEGLRKARREEVKALLEAHEAAQWKPSVTPNASLTEGDALGPGGGGGGGGVGVGALNPLHDFTTPNHARNAGVM